MRDACHFCNEDGALDRHHIVPKRHGGSDKDENLVTVCPTCHRKLEQLYNNRFYNEIRSDDGINTPFWWKEPVNHKNTPWTYGKWYIWICENEQRIRDIGHLRWPTFQQYASESEMAISKDAAKHIFRRLQSHGAIHLDVYRETSVKTYQTNRVWYDNIDEPAEADPETASVMELVRDE